MSKLICKNCKTVYDNIIEPECPKCKKVDKGIYHFKNSDKYLKEKVKSTMEERSRAGLDGLVGGLQAVIINTQQEKQENAVYEFLKFTGLDIKESFENNNVRTVALEKYGSADFIINSRLSDYNPFRLNNLHPKSRHLPDTRLETLVFKATDLEKYVKIQRKRGIEFLTDDIVKNENYWFIQTKPSKFTGNSLGFIQWINGADSYSSSDCREFSVKLKKPEDAYLKNIFELDHCATRLHARDRDSAIIEFMNLTNYNFDFAIYVKVFNSITNVARLSKDDYAMVFTSGISQYADNGEAGPTEKFVHNYGTRVHHMAFRTEKIEDTYGKLKRNGMKFLIELVGSGKEGLKQTFTEPSPNTLLVNEYIQRYGDFDGFFTRSNVTLLTGATDKQ